MSRTRLVLTTLSLVIGIGGSARGADIERDARELEARLIAPCCFSQQVSVHQSPAASEVRQDIRRRLAAGETPERILDAYRAQYGKRILAQPPAEGIDWFLYVLPPFGLVLTAGVVVMVVRRFTTRMPVEARPKAADVVAPPEDRYRAELDEQLRDLD